MAASARFLRGGVACLSMAVLSACIPHSLAQEIQPVNSVSNAKRTALERLILKKKFVAEGTYTGVTDESTRLRFEQHVNAVARKLLPVTTASAPKQAVLTEFTRAYPVFETADTEDRERAVAYFEEILDVFGITSSDGVLNKLLYGFDPTESADSRKAAALAAMTENERTIAKKLDELSLDLVTPFLTQTFGKPVSQTPAMTMWMISAQPMQAASLARQSGKLVLMWTEMGRFSYSRVFD